MGVGAPGTETDMEQRPEAPIGLEGLPAEEGVSAADAERELARGPDELENLSGEARRKQQESRERLAQELADDRFERDTPLAERRYPEDR